MADKGSMPSCVTKRMIVGGRNRSLKDPRKGAKLGRRGQSSFMLPRVRSEAISVVIPNAL
jgi:hypothetical protein